MQDEGVVGAAVAATGTEGHGGGTEREDGGRVVAIGIGVEGRGGASGQGGEGEDSLHFDLCSLR